jgi:hypothetical protein
MKHVLAELHELINDLEDQGLVSEASSLQEVFVRVAEDMEMANDDSMEEPEEDDSSDLAGAVAKLIDENGAAAVLQAVAEAMGGADSGAGDEDGETSSFANELPDSKPSILEIQDKHAKLAAEEALKAKEDPNALSQAKRKHHQNALEELRLNNYDPRVLPSGTFGGAVDLFYDPKRHAELTIESNLPPLGGNLSRVE